MVVGAIIASFLCLALIAIAVYIVTERCSKRSGGNSSSSSTSTTPVVACCSFADCFDRGEYECDEQRKSGE